MRRFTTSSAMVVVLACCTLFPPSATAGPAESDPAATEMLRLGLRGVYFVPNQGQWADSEVHYGLRSRGLDVACRQSALTMHMAREANESNATTKASPKRERGGVGGASHEAFLADASGSLRESAALDRLTLTITFPGSHAVLPVGGNPQAAKFNYFVGGEDRTTASDVPSFGAVIYENLYDGVDLHVMGNDDGVLKYEFHVAPGADYSQIRIAYDGIESLCIDDAGDLHINTSFGTLADGAPVVWQEDLHPLLRLGGGGPGRGSSSDFTEAPANTAAHFSNHPHPDPPPQSRGREPESAPSRQHLPARFELCDAHTYRIALDGPVDPTRELIIDPELQWMTYLGGIREDEGRGIAVDSAGNALVTGWTHSTDFEGRNNAHHGGDFDAFVLKVSASGALQWMTYLGGTGGDFGDGIALDSAGNGLVTGSTLSFDFEGRNNAYHGGVYYDAFIVKVSATGALQWMTYLGGSGDDYGIGIAVDSAGNALVTGYATSADFEGRNNAHHGGADDAFIVKVSASGVLQWMNYLGGSRNDYCFGIAVDSAGNALVTGWTSSTDFEGRNNVLHGGEYDADAFAVKVNASGALQWMSYLGGSDGEFGSGIAVDSAGNALVMGATYSSDFEGRNNAHHGGDFDAFVLKVSASGTLQWMIYLGGTSFDWGGRIAVDSVGNALVTGYTYSTDFEGRNNAYRGGVYYDAFVVKVSATGALQWMTYLGGSGDDYGIGIAVDSAGNALVTGYTFSTDFEGRNNVKHNYNDAFVVKLRIADAPQLSVAATCPSGGPIHVSWSGATPGRLAALIFASEQGAFVLPPQMPCAGTILGLGSRQLQVVWTGNTGPDGSGAVGRTAGPGACGGYLQLLDVPTCGTSNVVRVE
ncbi:MAG: SBBP repeat-containing protein [Phycisphaerales bacterium]|nr:SBBP repeat-containing protein [Phycisphaerales bacterium]